MVVKPKSLRTIFACGFESRVILDGSQTFIIFSVVRVLFESRVILDGSQTKTNNEIYNRGVWESCYFRW